MNVIGLLPNMATEANYIFQLTESSRFQWKSRSRLWIFTICANVPTLLLSQVSGDPVHRGALSYRAAASDGSDLSGGVRRQTSE